MFFKCKLHFMTLLTVISNVEADLITINWNISTNWGNSGIERDYKYPMYQEVAPVPCDLTTSCNAFCCQDPDCDEYEISQCSQPSNKCSGFLSFLDCNCNNFDKPEWLSGFCYVFKNPVFLGRFFETPKKIEKYATLQNVINKNSLFHYKKNKGEQKTKSSNLFGSPIMTFVPVSESFPSVNPLLRKVPLKDSTYACTSSPVSYRFNGTAICLTKITREVCQSGHALGVLPYLVQSDKSYNSSAYSNAPVVLKDPDFLEGLNTEVVFKCVELKSRVMRFKRVEMNFFQDGNITMCPGAPSAFHTVLMNNTCLNVLVYVQYQFTVNGSDNVKLKVEYGLTNISLPFESIRTKIYKYIYLKQKFSAHFFDIMLKSYENMSQSRNDDIYNRGYFIGEELNFGYKLIKKSSMSWKRGILGVFGKGGSCESLSPIQFGFQVFSVCHIRRSFPNCTQLRNAMEDAFEALLKGDSLAAYANLRPPYNNSVPLLRNYHSASGKNFDNLSQCSVPTAQKVLIQYTSTFTGSGSLIHRVIGVRIDRTFQNVSLTDEEIQLSAHASFFYVSSSEKKPLSRFWRKMLSRELSENSWLNIFNAFDDSNSVESEEITFWSIALILSGVAAAVLLCTKVDVHLVNDKIQEVQEDSSPRTLPLNVCPIVKFHSDYQPPKPSKVNSKPDLIDSQERRHYWEPGDPHQSMINARRYQRASDDFERGFETARTATALPHSDSFGGLNRDGSHFQFRSTRPKSSLIGISAELRLFLED